MTARPFHRAPPRPLLHPGVPDLLAESADRAKRASGISVPQDGPNNWYFPAADADWTALGLPIPLDDYSFQQGSGNLTGRRGNLTLTAAGSPTYSVDVANFTRNGIGFADGAFDRFSVAAASGPNPASVSTAWLFFVSIASVGAAARSVMCTTSGSGGVCRAQVTSTPRIQSSTSFGATTGSVNPGTGVIALLVTTNLTAARHRIYTNAEQINGNNGAWVDGIKGFGGIGVAAPAMTGVFGAVWQGADAETVDTKATLTALGIALPY